ncbi:hypothetical protein DSECCO2_491930 [anaerobic digester metagenome]|jgi:putative restriction endonuclease
MLRKSWSREELILTINLYCKTPFGKLHKNNPDVIRLAELIGRTPSAVSWKLVNFASLDPSLQARGIKGAINSSNLDKKIWTEFFDNWEELAYESEILLAFKQNENIGIKAEFVIRDGVSKERLVKTRVNQSFFRTTIMASYNQTCCITGIKQPELLVASHIRPWSMDEKNRLNPQNGICINALHDKAFEFGLLTITPRYYIKISSILLKQSENQAIADNFLKYNNQPVILPSRFLPDPKFLKYHNDERFIQ